MRSSKADAANSLYRSHCLQQLSKAGFAARILVGINVLPQKLNVRESPIGHSLCFCHNGIRCAAAFLAARVGDNAVGAKLVAAFNDGDVSTMFVGSRGKFGIEGLIGLPVVQS